MNTKTLHFICTLTCIFTDLVFGKTNTVESIFFLYKEAQHNALFFPCVFPGFVHAICLKFMELYSFTQVSHLKYSNDSAKYSGCVPHNF